MPIANTLLDSPIGHAIPPPNPAVVLAILPPLLWGVYLGWRQYLSWQEGQLNQAKWEVRVYTLPAGGNSLVVFPRPFDHQNPPQSP